MKTQITKMQSRHKDKCSYINIQFEDKYGSYDIDYSVDEERVLFDDDFYVDDSRVFNKILKSKKFKAIVEEIKQEKIYSIDRRTFIIKELLPLLSKVDTFITRYNVLADLIYLSINGKTLFIAVEKPIEEIKKQVQGVL